jgi:hypothetical protein
MAADTPSGNSAGGTNRPRVSLPIAVTPSTDGDLPNVIGPPSAPLACWRFEDAHFAFDSAVINPNSKPELGKFKTLWDQTGHAALSLFGHADPVGDDEYNKTLSGRRATAMYGLLTRNVDLWEELYTQPFSTDNWATNGALPLMRDTTGEPESTARKDLFLKYMDAVCQDSSGQPFTVDKTGFIAQGKDAGGKGDYQGCSEFNPILLFSNSEAQALDADHDERDRENQPNRRVMIFLFPPGLTVDPNSWFCPRAKEASAGCRAHFWPDGDTRRANTDVRRAYETDRRTFACAWYDALARRSPCEILRKTLKIRLLDWFGKPVANAHYQLTIGADEYRVDDADADGWLTAGDVMAPSQITVDWGLPENKELGLAGMPYQQSLFLDVTHAEQEEADERRLSNLGYPMSLGLEVCVKRFQEDYNISPVTGQLDDEQTRPRLKQAHDEAVTRDEG